MPVRPLPNYRRALTGSFQKRRPWTTETFRRHPRFRTPRRGAKSIHTPPQGGLPSQDHADPAPPQANPLANALAQVADTLTTVTTGIAALSRENSYRKPYLEGSIDVQSTFDDKKNDFNQWTKEGLCNSCGTITLA